MRFKWWLRYSRGPFLALSPRARSDLSGLAFFAGGGGGSRFSYDVGVSDG